MSRAAANRANLLKAVRMVPFEPFVLNLENGDRVVVEHPENIAFDADENGRQDVYVITSKVRYWGNLSAITTIAVLDREQLPSELANGRG